MIETKLKAWRLANELTLDEVADLIGYHKSFLSRAERGQRHFAPMTKVEISRRLGVRVRDLFEVEALEPLPETPVDNSVSADQSP